MPQTWRDGSTTARTAADLELADAAALHASQHAPGGTDPIWGVVAADIDSAITPWDDPLGLGVAATAIPSQFNGGGGTIAANRAVFYRCISGSVVTKLYHGVSASSGNYDVGIYSNTGTRDAALPNARQASSGSIPVPGIGATVVTISSVTVKARQHWMALAPDNATAAFWIFASAVLTAPMVAGWACFKDAQFPLPASITSPTIGSIRHVCLIGRNT